MLRKLIPSILILPFFLNFPYYKTLAKEKDNIILKSENEDEKIITYEQIGRILLDNNQELKSLDKLLSSSTFNLASKIGKRYPKIDLVASGFPQYVNGKSYNSNTSNLKTSQISANPTISIRWDIISPLRGPEIKIAKNNYNLAKNNYEIKKNDLIQEARSRFHRLEKSYQDIENRQMSLDLSATILKDALSKFKSGIGTKFEVLEAEAQLARDKQFLNETKFQQKINIISLKEILNIKTNFKIAKDKKLVGYWNYDLKQNIKNGLENNLSLQNILIQKSISKNQAKSFLNSNKPNIYLQNRFSSSFTKGDSLSLNIDPKEYGSNYANTISLNFDWNIFNGGQNKNSYKSKIAESESQELSLRNFKNITSTNISEAYYNLKSNKEKIISTQKEVSTIKESLRLAKLRYDVGISTLKDILVIQKELSDARSKNINAIFNYNLNLNQLERLTFLESSNSCIEKNEYKEDQTYTICNI